MSQATRVPQWEETCRKCFKRSLKEAGLKWTHPHGVIRGEGRSVDRDDAYSVATHDNAAGGHLHGRT